MASNARTDALRGNTVLVEGLVDRPSSLPWWRRLWPGRRAQGEMSAMRASSALPGLVGGWSGYTLDSSRVNYELARCLYRNTDERYKLGAGFAKPIVNTKAGFIGVPKFVYGEASTAAGGARQSGQRRPGSPRPPAVPPSGNREATSGASGGRQEDAVQQALDAFTERWSGKLLRLNRNALRDGDVFARLTVQPDRFNPKGQQEVRLQLIPPEWVTPHPDPTTGEWRALVIRWPVKYHDEATRTERQYHLTETLTVERRTIVPDDTAPADALRLDEANPWPFIPVVHFRNEAEETQLFGASDLEPAEPFMKAYHDVMLNAAQGSKLFSRPKVKMQLKDVAAFIRNNFTPEEIASKKLSFQGKDIYFMAEGEDASFITADSGIVGITTLLEFLFFCIVDVSQVPEFVFGTAIASSKASAAEQMTPFVREVERKRGQLEEPYGDLAAMFLAMWAQGQNLALAQPRARMEWPEVAPRDEASMANASNTAVTAMVAAVAAGLITRETARDFLRRFFPGGIPEDEEERVLAEKEENVERAKALMPPPAAAPPAPGQPPQARPGGDRNAPPGAPDDERDAA